ncbi:MAG: NAD(P)-dependent oxidoreductase [Spirochaetia bacterium]|nr:NAD(P)-dependent oxidoreductase [Spirochaetia bacterium]
MHTDTAAMNTIGWIGTGVMGRWMCSHLLKAGYQVVVHNRTKEKAQPLLQEGARWVDSPAEAARQSQIIFTIIGYPKDVQEVYFGPDGIIEALSEGAITIDMTTTSPSLSVRIAQACTHRGAHALDAPVSGGDVGAREARLAIMAGGEKQVFDQVLPLFELMGKHIMYEGAAGSGQHTKMCNQITIAGTMIGVCEAMLYGARAGLDMEKMVGTISKGAAGCWTLDNLAPRIIKKDYDPGFFVDHFIKDMGIALEEAARMGIALPGLALVHQLYLAVQASGHGLDGTQALIGALDRLSQARIFS